MTKIKAPGILNPPITIAGKTTRPMGAGIQLIWAPASGDDIPEVKSIQGIYRWIDVQPTEAAYDFRLLHSDLKRSYEMKKPIMLQLNLPAPEWLKKYVAVVGKSRGGFAYQYWDPIYRDWHIKVLQKFAYEIAISDYKNMVIGVRVQVNGYNTEYFIFEPGEFDSPATNENDRSTWYSIPPTGAYAPNRTDKPPAGQYNDDYGQDYMRKIQEVYKNEFHRIGIKTAWRTLLINKHFPNDPGYADRLFQNKELDMALDTRCGMNPADGMRSRYALLQQRCRQQGYAGYWEGSQYEWLPSPEGKPHTWDQNIYWRTLISLDAGIAYVAVYGLHIGYNQSFDFVNKYAGYHKYPVTSPGAWIAFHESAVTGNLGFFITQTNIADTVAVKDISTDHRMAFARQIKTGKTIELTIDAAFFDTIKGKPVELKITWYGNGSKARYGNIEFGDASNKVNTTAIVKTILNSNKISIKAQSGSPIIHMIEVVK